MLGRIPALALLKCWKSRIAGGKTDGGIEFERLRAAESELGAEKKEGPNSFSELGPTWNPTVVF
ncbi:MAG: hypothetical protein ACLQU2_05695 [Candidatus Binataceae bacterium]